MATDDDPTTKNPVTFLHIKSSRHPKDAYTAVLITNRKEEILMSHFDTLIHLVTILLSLV